MKITVDGKVYYADKFTPAMVMRADQLLELGSTVSLGDEPEFLDQVIPFLAGTVFQSQFTSDAFLNGYQSATVLPDILGMLGAVRGVLLAELAKFPAEQDAKNAHRGRKSSVASLK